ncbi:hypothetical protein C0Z17_08955 [Trinickia caryophylli]|nr:hypothetical protein C0Z17_08955 [Trinickia caryophylli]
MNRYCFAHVPRTGGSALLDFLFTNLGNDFVLDTFVESKRFSIFAELRDSGSFQREFASHRFLHIHVPVQIQRYLEPEKVACFTVLRHPFDRIVSYYEWSRKIYRDTQNEQFGCRPEVSLESFIESKMDDISVFNIYTYFFACLVDEGVVRHDVWRSIIVAPPKDAYALALEALRSFYLTAPLEELANAAAILAAIHEPEFLARQQATGAGGLAPLRQVSRSSSRTVTRHGQPLSLRAIELLMEACRYDLPLYEYCMNRFYRQWGGFLYMNTVQAE